jgi:hypothetical protein
MAALRRRLVSGALALTVLQLAVLFAAPVSACCMRAGSGHHGVAVAADEVECCPAGSHAPGQCPRHRDSKSRQTSSNAPASRCRMMCDAPHGPLFLIGTIGLIAAPESLHVDFTVSELPAGALFTVSPRPTLPDAPPPRSAAL